MNGKYATIGFGLGVILTVIWGATLITLINCLTLYAGIVGSVSDKYKLYVPGVNPGGIVWLNITE